MFKQIVIIFIISIILCSTAHEKSKTVLFIFIPYIGHVTFLLCQAIELYHRHLFYFKKFNEHSSMQHGMYGCHESYKDLVEVDWTMIIGGYDQSLAMNDIEGHRWENMKNDMNSVCVELVAVVCNWSWTCQTGSNDIGYVDQVINERVMWKQHYIDQCQLGLRKIED